MTEPTERPTSADLGPALQSVRGRSRRRLLQGGLGATPLLMTLISRPALGGGFQCFTPSGFVSMPTSQHGQPQYCSGRTPGFWKNSWDDKQGFKRWPAGFYAVQTNGNPPTLFNSFFGILSPISPYPNSATFLDVLKTEDQGFSGPPHNVARHIVASVLNVAKGWVPVLTIQVVKDIWASYINTGGGTAGYYEPTAGVKWYHDDIVEYLLSTMTGG